MYIKCPICGSATELDHDEVPELACDDTEWECPRCESTMLIGWYAKAEVRGNIRSTQEAGDE